MPGFLPQSYTKQISLEVAVSPGHFIQWQDLLVLVDNGKIPIARYAAVEAAVRDQARSFPGGIAVLCILPPDATPPPDEVKRCVKASLLRVASAISCLAYVIEGSGFKAVAARATLVGMKIFSARPYPIYVETSLYEALSKMVSHMANGHAISIEAIMKVIAEARLSWSMPLPELPRDHSSV